MAQRKLNTVAIVGAGLIGGSIGLALQERGLCSRVIGIGRRPASLRRALACKTVTETTIDLHAGVAQADLVVVCTPVESIPSLVAQVAVAAPARCVITDAGSIKAPIVRDVAKLLPAKNWFVGSHPMAGSDQTGPEHATAALFVDRTVVVTPTRQCAAGAAARVGAFWRSLGAKIVKMSPELHDRGVAVTSHLPHLLASAIAGSTPEHYFPLVATGWLDTTRIAAGDPELWRQIFQGNRRQVLAALRRFERMLGDLAGALAREDGERLHALLARAKRNRDALGS